MLTGEWTQVMDEGLLRSYEGLLTPEEHAHMMEGSTPAIRKERLLARVLVRTTLSRCAPFSKLPSCACPAHLCRRICPQSSSAHLRISTACCLLQRSAHGNVLQELPSDSSLRPALGKAYFLASAWPRQDQGHTAPICL